MLLLFFESTVYFDIKSFEISLTFILEFIKHFILYFCCSNIHNFSQCSNIFGYFLESKVESAVSLCCITKKVLEFFDFCNQVYVEAAVPKCNISPKTVSQYAYMFFSSPNQGKFYSSTFF